MKKLILLLGVLATLAAARFQASVNAGVVYDNTLSLNGPIRSSTNEYGDQIVLAGGTDERLVTGFRFGYWLTPEASGNETVRVRFYDNTATNSSPGNLLFDSGALPVFASVNGYSSYQAAPGVIVPDTFTWTVQWDGIETDEKAALVFNNPPTIGQSTDAADGGAYWERLDGVWTRRYNLNSTPPGNFYAQVVATNIPVTLLPEVVTPPLSQEVTEGDSLAFTVTAAGTDPLYYQWQFNESDILDATNSSLRLDAITPARAGGYRVIITNIAGAVTSAPAVLAVQPLALALVIFDNSTNYLGIQGLDTEFGDQITLAGNARFRNVTEFEFEYFLATNSATTDERVQIRFYDNTGAGNAPGIPLYDSGPLALVPGFRQLTLNPNVAVPDTFTWTARFAGAAAAGDFGLTIYDPPAIGQDPATYWTRLETGWTLRTPSNGAAPANFRARITAAVQATNLPPMITSIPQDILTTNGQSAIFTVAATGSQPLAFQWQFNGSDLDQATNSVLVLTNILPSQAGQYRVVVSNQAGSETSPAAKLSVLITPEVLTPPASQTVIAGAAFQLSVAAAGSAPLSYQWHFNGEPIAAATNNTLGFGGATAAQDGVYSVSVDNVAGSILAAPATIAVVSPPETRLVYDNTATYLGRMVASTNELGDEVVLAGTALERFVTGFRALYYLGSGIAEGETAVVRFYDNTGTNQTPNRLLFESGPLPLIPGTNEIVVAPQVAVPGDFTWSVQFSGPASVNQAGLPFYNPPILGSSASTLWMKTASAWIKQNVDGGIPGNFYAQITAGPVPAPPIIYRQPQSQSVPRGGTAVFEVRASSALPLQYQWWFNDAAIEGATNAALTLPGVGAASAGAFGVVVTNSLGSVTSQVAILTVLPAPEIVTQPVAQSVSPGADVTFQVAARGAEPISYRWFFNGAPLDGETNASLALAKVGFSQAGLYHAEAINAAGATPSDPAALTLIEVHPPARLLLGGPLGGQYLIQSLNAFGANPRWSILVTPTLTNNPTSVEDTNATAYPQRFYRAIWLP